MDRDTSKIWIISDTHWSHKNIIKYCNRPFDSVREMDEELIKRWNSKVKQNDRVFHLGDFCLAGKDRIIEVGRQLNGRKTLLTGNHDSAALKTYYEAGFECVYKHPFYYDGFIFSHEPLEDLPLPNIHGHLHQKRVEDLENFSRYQDTLYMNACVEVHNFEPVLLSHYQTIFELSNK